MPLDQAKGATFVLLNLSGAVFSASFHHIPCLCLLRYEMSSFDFVSVGNVVRA